MYKIIKLNRMSAHKRKKAQAIEYWYAHALSNVCINKDKYEDVERYVWINVLYEWWKE